MLKRKFLLNNSFVSYTTFIVSFSIYRLTLKDGKNAASLFVAEQYVNAFNKLARTNNTLILPSNAGDITSLVGQAMSIYKTVSNSNSNDNNNNNNNNSNGNNNPLYESDLNAQATSSVDGKLSEKFSAFTNGETDTRQSASSQAKSPDTSTS